MIIYITTNLINNKQYIGLSKFDNVNIGTKQKIKN